MPHSAAAEVYISACNREHAECAMEFVNALDSNERVAALGHRAVPLSDVDLRCIAEAIRSLNGECALKVLNLEENAFGLNGVQALMEALESNPGCIRELRLGKNNLKDAAASAIGQILSHDGCGLKVLDLSENGITKHGVIPIASALQNPTCDIVELSFHNNKIDSDAAAYLGQAIRSAPKLKHLHLGYNALRDSGASQLAKSLPEAVCLSTLDLTANRIGPVGGEALVRALKKSSCTVQRLNLRHNLLDSDTILMFADVIRTNTSLIQLFLGFMNPTPEVAAEVLNALRDNRPLLLLDIYGWKLHSRNALDVIRGIQENNTTLAAIVSDGCAQIAPQIDEGNNARESKDLHPLYVGPDDRDAYLATKSLKRYSRAQSRRQSRASSTRGSRAGSTRGRTSRRASTSHRHSSRHDSRAPHDSRGERSERSGRSTSRGAHEHKDERGERREARSDREGRSERATSRGTHDHRDDRSERKEARSDREGRSERATSRGAREHKDDRSEKREARSDRETRETNRSSRHESGRNRDEPAETPASRNGKQSQPPARGEERRDTGSEEDRDIEALLRELRKTPCDPSTARVIEGLVRALQRKIDRQCGCGKQDNRGIAQTRNGFPNDGTNRQNNQFPPQGQGSSNTYGNNSNNRQNPNTYGRQPTNNNYTENNSSNPGYGRTNDAPSPYANGATSNDNSYQQQQQQRQNLYQRSVSREWERAETPLVRPNSELRDVPPDLARHNEGPGEERPEEASLQRSVYVQNFPPRIEPSPAQDANPPRRKSVSHML